MKNVHENVLACIGNTPSVRLTNVSAGLKANLYAKVEYLNPGGSVKDRIAEYIIRKAEERGEIQPGGTIIEGTSGNTGAGLAMTAALRGYKTIFVMPDKQSEEKRAALRAYGARVVVTPTNVEPEDPNSYYSVAARLVKETPNSFYANQYHNQDNPDAHYESTGPEIWEQFDGKIDVFIAGLGTGGTITGVGKYLKEKNPDIKIVGVDPVGSLYYDYFHTGQLTHPYTYVVEGIGEDFLPTTMNFEHVDEVIRVNDKECFQMTRRLVREEGLFVGGSCGAAVAGALKYLRLNDNPELNAVVLLPDSGSRYLSKIFNDNWMRENGFLEPQTGLGTVSALLKDKGSRDLITATHDARVSEVIGLMKLHGISQMPVMENDNLIGIVHEKHLLSRALEGGAANTVAREVIQAKYCTVDETTEITVLMDLFQNARVAVVVKDHRPTDIITRIDLIDYVSRATKAPREI